MGFLALLTPCVFPMVPITVSFFSHAQEGPARGGTGGAVAYCLGIILTFTGLGLLLTVLFGASGIDLSFLRVPIGASDFTAGAPYTYDDGRADPALARFSIA